MAFTCYNTDCDRKNFVSKFGMEAHNRAVHRKLQLKGATQCSECGTLFDTQGAKLVHMKAENHGNAANSTI